MEVPRGFTRCDECEDGRIDSSCPTESGPCGYTVRCPSCSGSGLVPTEKLREDVARELHDTDPAYSPPYWEDCDDGHIKWYLNQADAVLRKVAEHLGGGE